MGSGTSKTRSQTPFFERSKGLAHKYDSNRCRVEAGTIKPKMKRRGKHNRRTVEILFAWLRELAQTMRSGRVGSVLTVCS